ncbi:MAG: hypothetical protein GXX04_09880 [Clostridiaceae bacterium]|nr:hypothetical protein [Clostridiaceae bacterium]
MGFLIHNQRLILSIIITASIALSGCACSLVLACNSSAEAKRSFLYLALLVFVHECSSLLAFYASSPGMFRRFFLVKAASAYLLKSAMLLFTGFYTERRWLKALSLGIHLLSIGQVLFLFLNSGWADAVISFEVPFEARYQDHAYWYMVVPGMLYLVMSVVFMLCYKPLSRKSIADSVYVILLLTGIAALLVFYLSAYDTFYDGMHLFILIGSVAANMKAMPLTGWDSKYLSRLNILEGFSEAIIFYDRKGRIIYTHDGLEAIRLSDRLDDIHARIMETGALNGSDSLSEGRITMENESPVHLQYKVSTLQTGGRVFGRIVTLRDVSRMVELQMELSGKNRQLELAFARKKRVTKAIRHLAMEKERARILDKVNSTANSYITRVRLDVARLESEMSSGPDYHHKVRMMNDQLLEYTRSVIEKMRATVKKLNLQPVTGESSGDTE